MNLIEIQKNLISGFFLKLYILYVLINLNYVLMNVFKRKFYTNTNYNKRIEWILKCPRGFFFSCMILHKTIFVKSKAYLEIMMSVEEPLAEHAKACLGCSNSSFDGI